MPVKKIKQKNGFTLIELLVTLVVLVVSMAIGIPAYSSMMTKNRLDSAMENVRSAYNFALSESFKSRQKVGVCGIATDAATECVTDSYTAKHSWSGGLMAFSGEIDSPTPLRYWDAVNGITFTARETGQFDSGGVLLNEENDIQVRESDSLICMHVSIAGQVSKTDYRDIQEGECF